MEMTNCWPLYQTAGFAWVLTLRIYLPAVKIKEDYCRELTADHSQPEATGGAAPVGPEIAVI